jgi:uncharacterized membrane protein
MFECILPNPSCNFNLLYYYFNISGANILMFLSMDTMFEVIKWYFYIFVVGLVFAPISSKFFPRNLDRGYAFAKIIGILIMSYIFLVFGTLRLLPFGRVQIIGVIAVFAFIFYKRIIFAQKFDLIHFVKTHFVSIRWAILVEIIFFVSLLFWSFVRSQEPSIRGLEKFMDYGFMQSIMRAEYMPPLDMWYSADLEDEPNGYFINYYYFGHLTGSLLIKLSDIRPQIGYNLVLANLFALGMTMTFSIVTNLIYLTHQIVGKTTKLRNVSLIFYGLVGAWLVNLAGNWHSIYLFTKGYPNENPLPPWAVLPDIGEMMKVVSSRLPNVLQGLGEYSKYWYPNATRFIPNTIHEFPSYSYVVADLHGHVFDIPFVLLSLAIVFFCFFPVIFVRVSRYFGVKITHLDNDLAQSKEVNFLNKIESALDKGGLKSFLKKCLSTRMHMTFVLAFMASAHYMTNASNGPIYLLFFIFVLLAQNLLSLGFVLNLFVLGFGFFYFSSPFSLFFDPFVSGIGINCGYPLVSRWASDQSSFKLGPLVFDKGNCQVSEPYQLGILWGMFFLFACILLCVIYYSHKKQKHSDTHVGDIHKRQTVMDWLIFFIFAFGAMLIIVPEFIYIKDIYPTHYRANTMFKLGYQAYIMMSLASAYVLWRIMAIGSQLAYLRYFFVLITTTAILLVSPYIYFAVTAYYGVFDRVPNLDGTIWLKKESPDVYEIVGYLNKNVIGQPVILEAQGDSYTDYNSISSYTGLPTVAGWWVHEWLWRGNADIVGKRIPYIEAMYKSEDLEETRVYLQKFAVKYVVVSTNERKKYEVNDQKILDKKFIALGREVFRSSDGKGVVYEIK